jgi:hypothetical protein
VSQAMNGASSAAGHERCGGRTRTGSPCKLPAGHGTDHPGVGRCDHHGGATPTHRAHSERVLIERAEARALAELHRLGVPPVTNPLELLAELAGEARGWQELLRAQVAELASLVERAPDGAERVRATVALYERSLDRTAAFAAMMAKLNIDDRLYKLNNRIGVEQGNRFAAAIIGILEDLGFEDPQHDPVVAPVVVARLDAMLAAVDDG